MKNTSKRIQSLPLPFTMVAMLCTMLLQPMAADEGMWTFDNPPTKLLQEKYGFTPTKDWLDHLRLASVRFNSGGSGSFVSPRGLALTNHHVAQGQLQKVSTPQKDYVKDGFFAKTQAEEMRCPDLELNVLESMQDVTARVQGAAKPGMKDAGALKARQAEIAKIESESLKATGLRSDVVPLYQGGEYWLYRYKKYTDIRLVFAPEQQIAFFGGDPDNFTYPRYDLDMALFRVYEDGKPIQTPNYLKWNAQGASDNELVFVSGNPGSTSRLDTLAETEGRRDYVLPLRLKILHRTLDVLQKYSATGTEQKRQAAGPIFGLQNTLKVFNGQYQGLRDKNLMAGLEKREADFRAQVNSKPEWKLAYGSAWSEIAEANKKSLSRLKELTLWNFRSPRAARSLMASNALILVHYVTEVKKPDGERLEGFHDAELESLRFQLLSPAPAYPEMEKVLLTQRLQDILEELGPQNKFAAAVLNGKPLKQAVDTLFATTKIGDATFRKSLLEGGEAAVTASGDPMILMARRIDPLDRELQKWFEDDVQSVETTAGEKIAKARFAVYGKSAYPDATFTLRLAYGTVKGYPVNGTEAPPVTTLYGLYDRSYSFGGKPPFDLPERFSARKDKLDLSSRFNFVSTCDIIGGNSGSPVVNRNGEIVGLIFDGNIESLVSDFVYDEAKSRAVAVHTASMILALRQLYDAGSLADEIERKPSH
jgi:Peptidase S46